MSLLKLTVKQRLFCKAYLANGFNATQAALTAGYSEDSAQAIGSENLSKPLVKQFIDKRIKTMEEKLDITAEWKMKVLKDCIDGCMNGEASEKKIHPSGVVSAVAELNKMQGHYAPEKSEIKHDIGHKTAELIQQYEKDF
jgi:phage terminase small subunit